MAPPALAGTFTSGGKTSAEATGQTERNLASAHAILDGCGYPMGSSKVRRIVRRFEVAAAPNGWALFDYIATAIQLDADQRRTALAMPDVARAISYADPTGETAVGNVMRQRAS